MGENEENLFDKIDVASINRYYELSFEQKEKTSIEQISSQLFEKVSKIKSQNELDAFVKQMTAFSSYLDPSNPKHRDFYDNIETQFFNTIYRNMKNAEQCFQESFNKLPVENIINHCIIDGNLYISSDKLAQKESPKSLLPKVEDALMSVYYGTFQKIAPLLRNTQCHNQLREKINNSILSLPHQKCSEILSEQAPALHTKNTLKWMNQYSKKEDFTKIVKEILSKDSIFYKVSGYKGKLPDTLSERYDMLAQAVQFTENANTSTLKKELVYSDIKNGKADLLPAEKIARLFASEKHLGDLVDKISLDQLNKVLKTSYQQRINIPQNIYDKITNKKLAASETLSETLSLAGRMDFIDQNSSVKDHLNRAKIASDKLKSIKNGSEYSDAQETLEQEKHLNEITNEKYSKSAVLSQTVTYIEELQKLFTEIKNKADPEKEKHLSTEKIEQLIVKAISGKYEAIEPSEAKLPLLFGRKEEKYRQERLAQSINHMNKKLQQISQPNNYQSTQKAKENLLKLSGKILDKATLDDVKAQLNDATKDAEIACKAQRDFEQYRNPYEAQSTVDNVERLEKTVEANTKNVQQEYDKRLEKAKKHLKDKTGIDTGAGKSGVIQADKAAARIIKTTKGQSR